MKKPNNFRYSVILWKYDIRLLQYLLYKFSVGKDAEDILRTFRMKERFERSEETSAIVLAKVQ